MAQVLSSMPIINSENVSENMINNVSYKVLGSKEAANQITPENDEEFDSDESEEEEVEEEEDDSCDSLPEGFLAPEQEAQEASVFASELGLTQEQEALDYVGQHSWDKYDQVVDSYWKMVESDMKSSEYDQCAQEASVMNQQIDQVVLKMAKQVDSMASSSAVSATREFLYRFIESTVNKSYLFTENRGDFTIMEEDLLEAFRMMNKSVPESRTAFDFAGLTDYNSAEDADYCEEEDEEMDVDEPLEWESDVEEENEDEEVDDQVEESDEEPESSCQFGSELITDIVNKYIDLIQPSDDPEDLEEGNEEREPEVQEVDMSPEAIELMRHMCQEFVCNVFQCAAKVANQSEASSGLKKALTQKDIKFVIDFCPELHF